MFVRWFTAGNNPKEPSTGRIASMASEGCTRWHSGTERGITTASLANMNKTLAVADAMATTPSKSLSSAQIPAGGFRRLFTGVRV